MERCFKLLLLIVMIFTVAMFATSCGLDRKLNSWLNPEYETTEIRYTMQLGDTVWDIAEYYFVKQNRINNLNEFVYSVRHRNNLTQTKRVVRAGDVIIIPLSNKISP